jgi:hypothetical protein
METNTNNLPLVPIALTNGKVEPTNLNRIGYPGELINVGGTVYFEGNGELYKFDINDKPVLVGEINITPNGSQLGLLTDVKGILYFTANDGVINSGLYRIDPTTSMISRLGDAIINSSGTDDRGNIVNLGDSDYFIANNNNEIWRINRSSGALSRVTPNGLPVNISFDGNAEGTAIRILSFGSNLYFKGDNKIWKLDPETNNSLSIQLEIGDNPGKLNQVGNRLFLSTSDGKKLYQIDATSGLAVLATDSQFTPGYSSIDPYNFVDVNGVCHFTTNDGHKIWKIDTTGKAVLAGTIDVAPPNTLGNAQSTPSNFINVNGTLCFSLYDGRDSQIWKLQSDGTVASITNISSPTTGNFIKNITSIGGKLYFTAIDRQYGQDIRELDVATGNLTTFGLNTAGLGSKIIDVNGTPYFARGFGYEESIYKLAPAGTVVPTPTPTTPVVTPTTTPVVTPVAPITPVIPATINFSGQLKTATGVVDWM